MHGDVAFGPHHQGIEPGPLLGRVDQRRQYLVGARLVPLDDRRGVVPVCEDRHRDDRRGGVALEPADQGHAVAVPGCLIHEHQRAAAAQDQGRDVVRIGMHLDAEAA